MRTGSPFTGGDNPIEPYAATLTAWEPIGNITLALDRTNPLSDSLPNSMLVTFPPNVTGPVGFMNTGFWGMDVTPQTYTGSFYIRAEVETYTTSTNMTSITMDLRSNLTDDDIWVQTNKTLSIEIFRYGQVNFTLQNSVSAPNGNNSFAITFDGEQVAGQTFHFALLSLFPETFKSESGQTTSPKFIRFICFGSDGRAADPVLADRQNGLRKDIAHAFYDIKPGFLRCPGMFSLPAPMILAGVSASR